MRLQLLAWGMLASAAFTIALAQDADAVIAGSVHDAVTGSPIPDVQLILKGADPLANSVILPDGMQRVIGQARTDQAGNFRFEKLAAADYELSLTKLGYVDSRPEHVRARGAASVEDVRLGLTPTASLEGRILDALDQPLGGVEVVAERLDSKAYFPFPSSKEGRYRLENLVPGQYRIAVRTPYAIRSKSVERNPKTGEIRGYPNSQYYPGVDDAAQAGTVTLTAGAHIENFDIRLPRTPLVELSGQVIDGATRKPLVTGEVELIVESGELAEENLARRRDETFARRPLDGETARFRFDLLRPGRYSLLIYRDKAKDASPYVSEIVVPSSGSTNLQVSLPSFGSITGKLVIPAESKARPFQIRLLARYAPTRETSVRPDGSFEIDNLPPGPCSIEVAWTSTLVSGHLYVASIRRNGVAGPIVITEGSSLPVEIELSDKIAQISGVVSDSGQHPVESALVLVTRDTRVRYYTADLHGNFTAPLTPGEYSISAWPPAADLPADKAKACGDRMIRLAVRAGESAFVRLELCKP